MLAIICGNYEAAARLLYEGASPHQRNARGVSSADLAEEPRRDVFLQVFFSHTFFWGETFAQHLPVGVVKTVATNGW